MMAGVFPAHREKAYTISLSDHLISSSLNLVSKSLKSLAELMEVAIIPGKGFSHGLSAAILPRRASVPIPKN